MPDIDKLATQVLDAYAAAVHLRDADKLIGVYHPSAPVFDTCSTPSPTERGPG